MPIKLWAFIFALSCFTPLSPEARTSTTRIPSVRQGGPLRGGVKVPSRFVPNGHLFLQAGVNGAGPMWFAMDTGAPVSVLFDQCTKDLKLKAKTLKAVDGRRHRVVERSTLILPGDSITDQAFTLSEYVMREPGFPKEDRVCGILGFDFISRFLVELDYAAGTITLLDPDTSGRPEPSAAVTVDLNNQKPVVRTTITTFAGQTIEGNFMIDLGAPQELYLTERFGKAHGLSGFGPLTAQSMTDDSYLRTPRSLKLGKYAVSVKATHPYAPHPSLRDLPEQTFFDGLIGNGILKNFKVTLDYRNKQVFFVPYATP